MVAVSAILPALRAMKSSPTPSPPNNNSGGTRLSAQSSRGPGRLAFGHIFAMFQEVDGADLRRGDVFLIAGLEPRQASSAVTLVVAPAANAKRAPSTEAAATPAAANDRKRRRFGTKVEHAMHIAQFLLAWILFSSIRDRAILVADDDGMHDAARYEVNNPAITSARKRSKS